MNSPILHPPMLAEISDKMSGAGQFWFFGLGAAAIVWVFSRMSRYTLILAIPLAGLILVGTYREFFADRDFGSSVISEMGLGYLGQIVVATALPIACALLCSIPVLRSLRSVPAK